MKLLSYQARSFSWQASSQTLDIADPASSGHVCETSVIWIHIEEDDEYDQKRIFRHTLKHIKWITNKRDLNNIVLHSFAHLGGATASPTFAKSFIERLYQRLSSTGYNVSKTPFGWFCSWNLDVYGDSMAKVFTHIQAQRGKGI